LNDEKLDIRWKVNKVKREYKNVSCEAFIILTFKLLNPFLSSETDISPPPLLLFLLLNLENSCFKSWNVFLLDRIHSVTICVMLCYVMLCYIILCYVMCYVILCNVMLFYVLLHYSICGKGVRVKTSHIILTRLLPLYLS
jgi:hypothetical protein